MTAQPFADASLLLVAVGTALKHLHREPETVAITAGLPSAVWGADTARIADVYLAGLDSTRGRIVCSCRLIAC